eukprot:7391638-Prymnesium_polylepis.8
MDFAVWCRYLRAAGRGEWEGTPSLTYRYIVIDHWATEIGSLLNPLPVPGGGPGSQKPRPGRTGQDDLRAACHCTRTIVIDVRYCPWSRLVVASTFSHCPDVMSVGTRKCFPVQIMYRI